MSEKTIVADIVGNNNDNKSITFTEHLDAFRKHLMRSLIFIGIAFILVFINKSFVFSKVILAPKEAWFVTNMFFCEMAAILNVKALCINTNALKLINVQLAGQFSAHILISFVLALAFSFPFIMWQLWLFVKPALYTHEHKKVRMATGICSFLFFTGFAFAYFLVVPLTLNFLGNYQVSGQVENTITLMSYIKTVTLLSLGMGLVFQLPVMIILLSKTGILTANTMKKNRKLVFLIIIALSAIITPPDVFSQFLVAAPLYVLFEGSILFVSKQDKRKR